jgi:hypothetical protein
MAIQHSRQVPVETTGPIQLDIVLNTGSGYYG